MKPAKARRIVKTFRMKDYPQPVVDRAITRASFTSMPRDERERWAEYTRRKRAIEHLPAPEYDARIQEICKELGI